MFDPRTRPHVSHLRRAGVALAAALVVLGSVAAPAGAAPPPTPTGLAASTSPISSDTTFTWNPTPGAFGYRLLCEAQGFAPVIVTPVGGDTQATVRLPAATWLCDIAALAGAESSPRSAGVIVTIGPLPAPIDLFATTQSGEATVSWGVAPGGLVNGWIVTTIPPTTTTYAMHPENPVVVIEDLPVNVPFTFVVTPYRSSWTLVEQLGPSASSAPVPVLPVPAAPGVDDVETGLDHITVRWTPPTDTGGSPLLGYRINLTPSEQPPISVDVPASLTSLRLDGIDDVPGIGEFTPAPSQAWTAVTVQARTTNGYGKRGAWADVPVWTLDPPSPVGNLFVRTQPDGTAFVDWDEPAVLTPELFEPITYELTIDGPTPYTAAGFDQTQHYVEVPLDPGFHLVSVRVQGSLSRPRWATRWVAVGSPCDAAFPDVTGPPFCTHISWLVRSGITTGFGDGTFGPTLGVSRQSMAAFLYRAKGSPRGPSPTCTTAPFPDVPISSPFCGAIDWLVDAGVTSGFGDGTFGPTRLVSRQAMASFLYRAGSQHADAEGNPTTPSPCSDDLFVDVPANHPFCGSINWMVDAGVTSGFANGTFGPTLVVSRQSMATFLYRWHP